MKSADPASCHHHHKRRVTRAELRTAAENAKARATEAGLRWTAQRERALELLMEANGAVKAYDLIANFQPGAQTAPPTVYRALDTLVELGLAHRIASQNAYVACVRDDHGAHAASFLFCNCCGGVEEFEAPVDEIVGAIRAQSPFELRDLTVEAHGLCASCQPSAARA